jgi:hypothetical protein
MALAMPVALPLLLVAISAAVRESASPLSVFFLQHKKQEVVFWSAVKTYWENGQIEDHEVRQICDFINSLITDFQEQ